MSPSLHFFIAEKWAFLIRNTFQCATSETKQGAIMDRMESTIGVSVAVQIVGFIGAGPGLATVFFSTLLYIQAHDFSVLATYLSDIGNTPIWPQIVFNSGMLISAPVRYLFLVLLILVLRELGTGKAFCVFVLAVGVLVVAGSIGIAAIPYSLDRALHMSSALLYFFGTVVLQTLIGAQELRRRLPVLLPVSSLTVVTIYLIFALLLSLVGKVEGITRSTPVIWEWLAFCSLMFWLIAHAIILGDGVRRKLS